MNADFYEFRISDAPEVEVKKDEKKDEKQGDTKDKADSLPDLEPIDQ
jgi:hypothetical protein